MTANAFPNLTKYLAECGVLSRRNAEAAIRAGRVTVDGSVETNPARRIPAGTAITLDGASCALPSHRHYILLHKPRGYVCTSDDPHAAHKALDLIDLPGVRLFSAGRLDKGSEGAIIFSDDGAFVEHLSHPRYGVLKRYRVWTEQALSEAALERIRSGIEDDGEFLKPVQVTSIGDACYEFLLNEGKKREIRRLTSAAGSATTRLVREAIGPVTLGPLKRGQWRELTPEEREALLSSQE